jgi:hypothetical protein
VRRYKPNTGRIAHTPRGSGGTTLFVAPFPSLIGAGKQDVNAAEIKRLKQAAQIVADAVKQVSGRFSRRIPLTVSVKANERGIYIEAGGPVAPNAYPFDPPNNPPVWHPVYGRGPRRSWHWAPQPYRPFLEEAAEISIDQAAIAFSMVIDDWCKQVGLTK